MSLGRESWQEVVADKVAEVILETLYERPTVSLLTIRFILEVTKKNTMIIKFTLTSEKH